MAFSIFAMPASSVILLLSAAFGVSNGLPWPGPTPTNVYRADEWSPRPTSSPGNPLALFRRDGDTQYVDNTVCGWIGGKSDNPAVCRTGSACIIEISHGAPGYVGCCTTSGPCTAGVYTSCVDKNSPGGQSGPLVENNGVFTCPGDQECYKNTYHGGYIQYGCGKSDQATTVEMSFEGQPSNLLLQITYTGVEFKPTTISTTSTTSSSSASSTSESTTDSSSTPAASTTSSETPSSTSVAPSQTSAAAGDGEPKQKSKVGVGVIAGWSIGGTAFVIAVLGIILFFYRRRRNQRDHPRAGSFVSHIKSSQDPGSMPGTADGQFHQLQPFSPDDFVSPMTAVPQATPPMNPSAFQPLDHAMFSPTEYQGIEDRMRENAAIPTPEPEMVEYYQPTPNLTDPFVSEFDDFSNSFHAALAQMSPPTPPQAHFGASLQPQQYGAPPPQPQYSPAQQTQFHGGDTPETSNVELPPFRDTHIHSGQMPDGTLGVDSDNDDDYGNTAEDKEIGMAMPAQRHAPIIRKTVPGFRSENVRMEGWQPASLRPAKTESPEREGDATPRYQLVDQPPIEGVKVLHTAGLKGKHRK